MTSSIDRLPPQELGFERAVSFGSTGEIIVKTYQCTDVISRGRVMLTPDQAAYALSWGWSMLYTDPASGLLVVFRS